MSYRRAGGFELQQSCCAVQQCPPTRPCCAHAPPPEQPQPSRAGEAHPARFCAMSSADSLFHAFRAAARVMAGAGTLQLGYDKLRDKQQVRCGPRASFSRTPCRNPQVCVRLMGVAVAYPGVGAGWLAHCVMRVVLAGMAHGGC